MNNFLFNLAQKGAGLAPAAAVQADTTPYFAADPRPVHTAPAEGAPLGEPAPEMPASGVTASTRPPFVEEPEWQHRGQLPSPPSFKPVVATAYERESRVDETNRSEPRSEPISNHRQATDLSLPTVNLSAEAAPRLDLRVGSKAEGESAEATTPIRVVPRLQEVPELEAAVDGLPDASTAGQPPSRRSTESQALLPARLYNRSPAANLSENLGVTPPVPQPTQVRIGTIEVRATTPPATPTPAPQSAPVPTGFDDYTMIRSYKGWERY
jgi:hypothetical protein